MPTTFPSLLRNRRLSWLWLLPLLLVVTWLGARGLNSDAIWFDEWWSVYYAGGAHYGPIPLSDVAVRVYDQIHHENNPPGYYIALSAWGRLVGWTEYAARAFSLLTGLLAVAWMYRLGRDLGGPTVGLTAAVALGASAFFVFYLHEMRAYSFSLLLVIIVVWLYWRLLNVSRTGLWLPFCFFLSVTVLLYTHFFAALGIVGVGLYHLVFVPKRTQRWWLITGLLLFSAVLFLPWVGLMLTAINRLTGNFVAQAASFTDGQILELLPFMFSNGNTVLLLLLFACTLWKPGRAERFTWFWLTCVVALSLLINLWLSLIVEIRYVIAAWPGMALLAGFGVARLLQRRGLLALLLPLWVGVGVWSALNASPLMVAFEAPAGDLYTHVSPAFRLLPWHELRDVIDARVEPGDVFAYHRSDWVWAIEGVFDYYFHDLPVRHTIMEQLPGRDQNDEYLPSAQGFLKGASRAWIAVDKTLPEGFRLREFQKVLNQDFVPCGNVFDLPDMRLDLYARVSAADAPSDTRFGEGIALRQLEPPRVTDTRQLAVLLGWQVAVSVPANTYSVALHVERDGQLVAQTDYGLPSARYTCQPTMLPLKDLPRGSYQVWSVVYNWSTGKRLKTASGEDRWLLGSFELP
jgi:hypothetical protein